MKYYYDFIFLIIVCLFLYMIYLNNTIVKEGFQNIADDNDIKEVNSNSNNSNNSNKNRNKKYKRCDSLPLYGLQKKLFEKNNVEKTKTPSWDVYIPCGYNDVEDELLTIHPSNKDQVIYGISGCDSIVSKDHIWFLLKKKFGKDASKIMPSTWRLFNKDEMKDFKLSYNPDRTYILKKNVQRKEGLKLTRDYDDIVDAYSKENYRVVQEYIHNVFIVNKRKINLRFYLLIVCREGKVSGYLHREGKCIYTNKDYNDKYLDFESNITSFNLDQSIYEKNPQTFDELRTYLKTKGYDPEKLFKKSTEHLVNSIIASEDKLCKLKNIYDNTSFQLFGVDIIFDNELHPYLLEMNKGPDMSPKNDVDTDIKYRVLHDIFTSDSINVIERENNLKNNFDKIWGTSCPPPPPPA